jgi:hypothetical protein
VLLPISNKPQATGRAGAESACEKAIAICAVFMFAAGAARAGPVEYGLAELNAAMAARNLKGKNKAELSLDPPESFRIEPYSSGGAYITGGDVRGLMYGLLEAAGQIRATGRFAKAHGEHAAALRGVHIELDADLERAPEEFWRSYFQMLARNRFNRAHIVFQHLTRPYRSGCIVSRAAADYAVDFTLGVGGEISADEMGVLLAVCPAVRSVAVESHSPSRIAILEAVRRAGRLVSVDPDGESGIPANNDTSIAVLRPSVLWPPSFEVRPPFSSAEQGHPDQIPDQMMDPAHAADHAAFYWVWGRLGYDPSTKPPKDANPAEYEAARLAAVHIAAAEIADEGGSDHVAPAAEAVRNLKHGIASAKFTPLDIAARLESAAATLEKSAIPDFQAMAGMANDRARQQRSAYARALRAAESPVSPPAEESGARPSGGGRGTRASSDHEGANADHAGTDRAGTDHGGADQASVFYANATSNAPAAPRPQMMHKPNQATPSDQPLLVTLRIAAPKQVTLVRLHYRTLDPQSKEIVLEEQPSAEVHFTIPGSELTGTWDLFYYFEVLNREGSGWFEPDPLVAAPYFIVHIQAPRTGPN